MVEFWVGLKGTFTFWHIGELRVASLTEELEILTFSFSPCLWPMVSFPSVCLSCRDLSRVRRNLLDP